MQFDTTVAGQARKTATLRWLHKNLLPKIVEAVHDGHPMIIAGNEIVDVDTQSQYRSGKYDTDDYPDFPDSGIRFYLNKEKTSYITVRPSGTEPKIRIYVQIAVDITEGTTKEQLARVKKAAYKHALDVTTAWKEIAITQDIDSYFKKANDKEKALAKELDVKLHTPLDAKGDEVMESDYLKGGYLKPGYDVAQGASVDGSFAIEKEGDQGYYVNGGKEIYFKVIRDMVRFFADREKALGKPIRVIIKTGIGGQHTPFQGIVDAFNKAYPDEKIVILGEYELGKDYNVAIEKILKEIGADWSQVALIPSSKSGSTDETMLIFSKISKILLTKSAESHGIDGNTFVNTFYEVLHGSNFENGKEIKKDLFLKFNFDKFVEILVTNISKSEQGMKGLTQENVGNITTTIFGEVFGNMFFETIDRPDKSRLSAFVRNSGLGKILGTNAPGFGSMFDNVGGRWTADLHMMTILAYLEYKNPGKNYKERYWEARYKQILEVRDGKHDANILADKTLDENVKDIALVVPDELFWFGKSIEQNWNESIWQDGFANLITIKESDWDSQRSHYAHDANKLVINLAGVDVSDSNNVTFSME